MPIYERRCDNCAATFSHLCKYADRDAPKNCPNCDSDLTVPILSATKTDFKFADASPRKESRNGKR